MSNTVCKYIVCLFCVCLIFSCDCTKGSYEYVRPMPFNSALCLRLNGHGYFKGANTDGMYYRVGDSVILINRHLRLDDGTIISPNEYYAPDYLVLSKDSISCQDQLGINRAIKKIPDSRVATYALPHREKDLRKPFYKPNDDDVSFYIDFYGVLSGLKGPSIKSDQLLLIRQKNSYGLYYRNHDEADSVSHEPPVWLRCQLPLGIKYFVMPDTFNLFAIYRNKAVVWIHIGNNIRPDKPDELHEYIPALAEMAENRFHNVPSEIIKSIKDAQYACSRNSFSRVYPRTFAMVYNIPLRFRSLYEDYITNTYVEEPIALMKWLYSCKYYYEPFDRNSWPKDMMKNIPFYGVEDSETISKGIYGTNY